LRFTGSEACKSPEQDDESIHYRERFHSLAGSIAWEATFFKATMTFHCEAFKNASKSLTGAPATPFQARPNDREESQLVGNPLGYIAHSQQRMVDEYEGFKRWH
jgi:hypothetical protein